MLRQWVLSLPRKRGSGRLMCVITTVALRLRLRGRDCTQSSNARADSCLACRIGEQETRKGVDEGWRREQFFDLSTEELAKRRTLCWYLADNAGATVGD